MPLPSLIPSSKVEHDAITSLAIKSLEELVTRFPTRSIRKSSKYPYDIVDVSIDVKKTDSLIYPVIGIINFTTDQTMLGKRFQIAFEMVFDWQGDHWRFARLLNRGNGIDFTHSDGGKEMLETGPMSHFLKSLQ
jgi:hypothetical protein